MSMALVTTGGFGNGTLTTTIGNVVTRGYMGTGVSASSIPGLEYHLSDDRLHCRLRDDRPHHSVGDDRPHYAMRDDRPHHTVSDDRLHYRVD